MPLLELSQALGLGSDPDAILGALKALYAELDRALAERAVGLDLPCRRGCDACCHEAVFLAAPEFLAVAEVLLVERSLEDRIELVAAMRTLASRFEDELELLEILEAGAERDETAERIKFRCPLLGVDGSCSVYRARELNARTFGQSWDPLRNQVYGCELTRGRLRVLGSAVGPQLFGAREARAALMARLPGTARVRVYPWWFDRYGDYLTRT